MADQEVWIGPVCYVFDDEAPCPTEPSKLQKALRTEGQIELGTTPITDNEVVRKVDLDAKDAILTAAIDNLVDTDESFLARIVALEGDVDTLQTHDATNTTHDAIVDAAITTLSGKVANTVITNVGPTALIAEYHPASTDHFISCNVDDAGVSGLGIILLPDAVGSGRIIEVLINTTDGLGSSFSVAVKADYINGVDGIDVNPIVMGELGYARLVDVGGGCGWHCTGSYNTPS